MAWPKNTTHTACLHARSGETDYTLQVCQMKVDYTHIPVYLTVNPEQTCLAVQQHSTYTYNLVGSSVSASLGYTDDVLGIIGLLIVAKSMVIIKKFIIWCKSG